MSDIVDAVEMPDQDGKSPGDLWYGLPINPTLATHVWNGREWRPLLTEEGYYRAEITRLRNELHIAQEWSARVIAGHEQDIAEITDLRAEVERLNSDLDDASTDLATARQDNASLAEGVKSLRAENEKLRAAAESFWRAWQDRAVKAEAENARLTARIRELEGALEWYRKQTEGCRKIGSIGDPHRQALDADGGKRATAALKGETNGN